MTAPVAGRHLAPEAPLLQVEVMQAVREIRLEAHVALGLRAECGLKLVPIGTIPNEAPGVAPGLVRGRSFLTALVGRARCPSLLLLRLS